MARAWGWLSLVFVLCVLSFVHADTCGDNACETQESCFADCAGSLRKFICPFASNATTTRDITGAQVGDDTIGVLLSSQMKWALPGLEHINRGFDAITGKETPHPVINLLYCEGNPDESSRINYVFRGNTYRIPLGVHVVTAPECSVDASTTVHSYTHGFSQSMASEYELSVSISGHAGGYFATVAASAAFSKSESVEEAKELMSSGKTSLAVTSVKCLSFQFEWADPLDGEFGINYLHPDFERDLNDMQTSADAFALVLKYGTHFYKSGYLGGKLEMLTSISDSLLQTNGESSVSSKISASVSASITGGYGGFSGGLSAEASFSQSGETETTTDDEISNNTVSNSIRSTGGSPFDPASSTFGDWASSVDALPVPVDFQLAEILSILPNATNRFGLNIRDYWREAVVSYFSSQGATYPTLYKGYIYLPNSDNKTLFGPYAYNIFSSDGTPLLSRPSLFTISGTFIASMFINDADLREFMIPLDRTILKDIAYIEIYSFRNYFEQLGLGSMAQSLLSTYHPTQNLPVNTWPLAHISIFDETEGLEYFFSRYEDGSEYSGGSPITTWTPDKGVLFLSSRDFYEVQLIITPPGLTLCNLFPTTGTILFEFIIYGSKKDLTFTVRVPERPLGIGSILDFQIPSVEDAGIINRVKVSPIWVEFEICVAIEQVKVIDLNNRVYFSAPYPTPFEFQMPTWSAQYYFGRNAMNIQNEHSGASVYDQTFSPIDAYVSPWSDVTNSEVLYAYQVNTSLNQMTFIEAGATCNNAGGSLASDYQIEQMQELHISFCSPSVWMGSQISKTNITGSFYRITAQCYSMNTTCAGAQPGYYLRMYQYAGSTPPDASYTFCYPLCVGPAPPVSFLANHQIIGLYPLQLNFAGITVSNDTYNPGDNNTSLGAALEYENPPTAGPTSPPLGYIHYLISSADSSSISLSVTNSTRTITGVAFFTNDWTGLNGQWVNLTYTAPYWTATRSGSVSFPLKLSLLSATGQLFDTIPYLVNQAIIGTVQFN